MALNCGERLDRASPELWPEQVRAENFLSIFSQSIVGCAGCALVLRQCRMRLGGASPKVPGMSSFGKSLNGGPGGAGGQTKRAGLAFSRHRTDLDTDDIRYDRRRIFFLLRLSKSRVFCQLKVSLYSRKSSKSSSQSACQRLNTFLVIQSASWEKTAWL